MKSLRDVYEELGVSRTTLQGWLYDILKWPRQDTADNTALNIPDDILPTIWQIRFFKQLKYSSKKIKDILADPSFDLSQSLEKQIVELTKQKEELENLIKVAMVMKETGIGPNSLRFGPAGMDEIGYPKIVGILGLMADKVATYAEAEIDLEKYISDAEVDAMVAVIERVSKMGQKHLHTDTAAVQEEIAKFHRILSTIASESIIILSWVHLCFSPDGELGRELDSEYGTGSTAFFCGALEYYCNENAENEYDKAFYMAWEEVGELANAKYTTSSPEVQAVIQKLYDFFSRAIGRFSTYTVPLLKNLGVTYGSKEFRDAFENGAERGGLWFISRAIEIYCSKYENNERGTN